MQPSRLYDYLVTSRALVFDRVRPLTPEQYTQTFEIGLGSLARTLTHILSCEWYYVKRMMREDCPPYWQWPIRDEEPPAFAVLEAEWAKQATRTREAIATLGATNGWKAPIEYIVDMEVDQRRRVRTVVEDIFTQLILHEIHHRSQAMNMLRQLGVKAPDVDFNSLNYRIDEVE